MGLGASRPLRAALGEGALKMDASDEVWSLEYNHDVDAVRYQAEKLLAAAYGSDQSYFLVNGTSQGIQAAFLALRHGDYQRNRILLPRNAHISAHQGLILSGLQPCWLPYEYSAKWGISLPPPSAAVIDAINGREEYQAVFLVRPDYHGLCLDLRTVSDAAHRTGCVVVVDEAHGPHLGFNERLPTLSLQLGADVAVQSPHKLAGALTGGAFLHILSGYMTPEALKDALSLVTSTSPSHLILASLDEARRQLATDGPELLEGVVALAQWARDEIDQLGAVHCLGVQEALQMAADYDSTKLLINVRGLGISGAEAEELLRRRWGIQVELSTPTSVLALITLADTQQTVERLVFALRELKEWTSRRTQRQKLEAVSGKSQSLQDLGWYQYPQASNSELSPQTAFWSVKESVEWTSSGGRVAAEWVIPYPPGIPLIAPGEVISKEIIEYLSLLCSAGVTIRGMQDQSGTQVRVVRSLHQEF